MIGLADIDQVAESQAVISSYEDEDYETDHVVLKSCIKLCKRDLTQVYRHIVTDQITAEQSTYNFRH